MEQDATTGALAEAAEDSAPQPEVSAAVADPSESTALMNAMIRGELEAVASKPGGDADDEDADATDGVSAQSGVKPNDTAKPIPRRRAAAEIERLTAEVEQLKAQLAPPVPPDATEEARAAILEAEDRYRRLLAKPDDDADWTQDDYAWLQDEKRKRAIVPEVTRHFETVLERERAAARDEVEQERRQFWSHVASDLASAEELPGVDLQAIKAAPDFRTRDRIVYAAAEAKSAETIRDLRAELADAKRQLLGAVRPPLSGGRSSPGRTFDPTSVMNELIRSVRA